MNNKQFINNLSATNADIRILDAKKINLNGQNIFEHIGFKSYDTRDPQLKNDELDIWNSEFSISDNGYIEVEPVLHVYDSDGWYLFFSTQFDTIKSAAIVTDNEVLDDTYTHLLYWLTGGLTYGGSLFASSNQLTYFSSNLSSLTNGLKMFENCTNLTTFSADLSSLTEGTMMFYNCSNLTSFPSDLSSLTNGYLMFADCTNLTTFSSDLSSLKNGQEMFCNCNKLYSFTSDLSSLPDGRDMFYYCKNLTTFPSDLSSLKNGNAMFGGCSSLTSFSSDLSSLTDGGLMFGGCSSLTSFSSDLSSLTEGIYMFYECKLDAPSLANIIHTINTPTTKGTITIGLGIDDTDEARQALAEAIWCNDWNEVNQEFSNKNWTVKWLFNGTPTSAATLDIDNTTSPIWAKVEEVIADENGKLPHYSYVSEDGSKYFNLHWYHSSNGNNEGHEYFGSLLEACGYFGIVPKEYAEQN